LGLSCRFDAILHAIAFALDSERLGVMEQAVKYHRGYDVREPIEVRIGLEDLVVLSYPGPDRSVRLDELRAGHALPRR